jgi:hypothetical protein
VRFAYLDESGISSKERITVVAGVIIEADRQLEDVERYVLKLIDECVPEQYREGFAFHGKDLFHGSGRTPFDRRYFPLEAAHEILKRLLIIPAKFLLPIVYGFHDKNSLAEFNKTHSRFPMRVSAAHHAFAYSFCALAVESYMRDSAEPREVASLVVENNDNACKFIKSTHSLLRGRNLGRGSDAGAFSYFKEIAGDCVPIRKIKGAVHFASKDEELLLQVADVCAFIIRRFLEGKSDEEFVNVLTVNNSTVLHPVDSNGGFKNMSFAQRS